MTCGIVRMDHRAQLLWQTGKRNAVTMPGRSLISSATVDSNQHEQIADSSCEFEPVSSSFVQVRRQQMIRRRSHRSQHGYGSNCDARHAPVSTNARRCQSDRSTQITYYRQWNSQQQKWNQHDSVTTIHADCLQQELTNDHRHETGLPVQLIVPSHPRNTADCICRLH